MKIARQLYFAFIYSHLEMKPKIQTLQNKLDNELDFTSRQTDWYESITFTYLILQR